MARVSYGQLPLGWVMILYMQPFCILFPLMSWFHSPPSCPHPVEGLLISLNLR